MCHRHMQRHMCLLLAEIAGPTANAATIQLRRFCKHCLRLHMTFEITLPMCACTVTSASCSNSSGQ